MKDAQSAKRPLLWGLRVSTALMRAALQMVTNLLLDQVAAKEGHKIEPRGAVEYNEENRASQRGQRNRRRGTEGDANSHPDKCLNPVDTNDNFGKAIVN